MFTLKKKGRGIYCVNHQETVYLIIEIRDNFIRTYQEHNPMEFIWLANQKIRESFVVNGVAYDQEE